MFLKRFFLLYIFSQTLFCHIFFGNGDVEEFDFFLPCICFFGNVFFSAMDDVEVFSANVLFLFFFFQEEKGLFFAM